jgi:tetratricopeptide (TPR) repeat protein
MKLTIQNKKIIQAAKVLSLICCSMLLTSCAHVDKYAFERIGDCNSQIQCGNFKSPTETYEEAAKLRDRNYALWDNQLGSIYLAQGDYDKALDAFLRAHYLMNNIPAFKELERGAVSLTGSEDSKAYKGDPYEKAMNSLYVGLLLYNQGDLENAKAAFKNGILAGSDSKRESYKSDMAILYLLVSRISKKLGDESLSSDYYNVVKELENNSNYSSLGFSDEFIHKILDLKNNILLVVEFGEGPFKTRRGRYGELSVINGDRYDVNGWNIKIDGKVKAENQVYSNTDVYFQASTRGGRKMDGILKGKAIFKQNAANTAVVALGVSGVLLNQMNQTSDPYARAGLAAAAGISALFSGGAAIMSGITNPKADIRYWSLLPEHVIVYPLFISPGKHKISIGFIDGRNSYQSNNGVADKSKYEFDVDIQKDKDNIIFKRILQYKVLPDSEPVSLEATKSGDKSVKSENPISKFINNIMQHPKANNPPDALSGNREELIRRYVGTVNALNVIKNITFEEANVLFDKPVNLLRNQKTQEVISATYKIGNQEATLFFVKDICVGWTK